MRYLPPTVLPCALLAIAAIFAGATASASTLKDSDFSIELPDRACFVVPRSLLDDKACAGVPTAAPTDSLPPGVTQLGLAYLRLGEDYFAGVGVVRAPVNDFLPDNDDEAMRVVTDGARGMAKSDPTIERAEPVSAKLFMTAEGLRIVRGAIDITRTGAASRKGHSAVLHRAGALVYTEDATYYLTVTAPKDLEAEIDPIVDDALSTIRAPRPLQHSKNKWLYSPVTGLLKMVLAVLALVALAAALFGGNAWFRRWLRGEV
jgi:hypothetical protein